MKSVCLALVLAPGANAFMGGAAPKVETPPAPASEEPAPQAAPAAEQPAAAAAAAAPKCDLDGLDSEYAEVVHMGLRNITLSGCPNHPSYCTGKPNSPGCGDLGEQGSDTQAVRTDANAAVPAHPRLAAKPTDVACRHDRPVAYARNGVPVYSSAVDAECNQVDVEDEQGHWTTFDSCGGHTDAEGGEYHYHFAPSCLIAQMEEGKPEGQHGAQIGWAADGFPIYGPAGPAGKVMRPCAAVDNEAPCLDACGGVRARAPEVDNYEYRYYFSGGLSDMISYPHTPQPNKADMPFALGCLAGCEHGDACEGASPGVVGAPTEDPKEELLDEADLLMEALAAFTMPFQGAEPERFGLAAAAEPEPEAPTPEEGGYAAFNAFDLEVPSLDAATADPRVLWKQYVSKGVPVVLRGAKPQAEADPIARLHEHLGKVQPDGHHVELLPPDLAEALKGSLGLPRLEGAVHWSNPDFAWGGSPGNGADWHIDDRCAPAYAHHVAGTKAWRIQSNGPEKQIYGCECGEGDVLVWSPGYTRHATQLRTDGAWSVHGEFGLDFDTEDVEAYPAWAGVKEDYPHLTCASNEGVTAPAEFGF